MARCCLSSVFALLSVAALSGCGMVKAETPEGCLERFEKLLAAPGDLHEGRFMPVFTYDVTHMSNVLEYFAGDPEKRVGLQMTIAHGASDAALRAFYAADVPPKGAILAADNVTLFRINGASGSRHETLVAGCRGAPPDARLVHVQWSPLRPGTDGLPVRADPAA